MKIYHNSRDSFCRSPFGAVPQNAYVDLSFFLYDCSEKPERVYLDYAYGLLHFSAGSSRMHAGTEAMEVPRLGGIRAEVYTLRIRVPATSGLLFYSFRLLMRDGTVFHILRRDEISGDALLCRESPVYEEKVAGRLPFQITIYDATQKTPDAFKGQLMYQIFPDRFARDEAYLRRREAALPREERIYHERWDEEVDIDGKDSTGYIACDFFGGSLEGIRRNLDYLSELSVSVLYLNPIFEARSNHRYDAANYAETDPLLGSREDFQRLCAEAAARGIKVVIDASFSHTGADSIYFNKFGRYDTVGAYQDALGKGISDFYSWYRFFRNEEQELQYESWWGFPDLPSVNENDLHFREYILGDQGIVRSWLRLGASGFRLDVSDELPDDFLRDLYLTVKSEKSEALILGEVWEDASNKFSYGNYRDFVFGHTHDSVMGYPFRAALLDFFRGESSAETTDQRLETIRENYPPEFFAVSMHLLGSHDLPRFATAVAGDPDPGQREQQLALHLSPAQKETALTAYLLASAFQMAYPGMPSIYYGDEIGMEGYRDPFNRRPFAWGELEAMKDFRAQIALMAALRREHSVLQKGYYATRLARDGVLIFERFGRAEEDAFGSPLLGARRALCMIVRDNSLCEYEWLGTVRRLEGPAALWVLDRETYVFRRDPSPRFS